MNNLLSELAATLIDAGAGGHNVVHVVRAGELQVLT